MKVSYPQYQLFKNRIVLKELKDLSLVHKPIERSIKRVRGQMEKLGLLCPIVLSPFNDNLVQTGYTNLQYLQSTCRLFRRYGSGRLLSRPFLDYAYRGEH